MIEINLSDKARLQRLAQDEKAVEALKKLFLSVFLKTDTDKAAGNTQWLAASRLSLDFMMTAFYNLDRMKEEKRDPINSENPV